jgi:ribonuclease HII
MWSHKWGLNTPKVVDGVYVQTFTVQPEYWATPGDMTIGVYAHELGHGLGLPDLYDVDYTSQGVGKWCLMSGGSWNGYLGNSPAHPSAWCLKEMGVKDSKILSPIKRQELMDAFQGVVSIGSIIIPAESIDNARKKMTMNRLEVLAFASSLASVIECGAVLHPDLPDGARSSYSGSSKGKGTIMLDAADVDENRFGREVGSELERLIGYPAPPIISKHRADGSDVSVGAASIAAKVIRDREIERIKAEIGADIGSGYPSDPVTRRFLSNWVREHGRLPPECRNSWETARKLLSKGKQSDILSFC